jgi:hypothetical protein
MVCVMSESSRGHADNGEGTIIQLDCSADDRPVRVELTSPQTIADDRHRPPAAPHIISRIDRSSTRGANAQHAEVIP